MPPATSTMLPLSTPCPAFALPDHGVEGDHGTVSRGLADAPVGTPILVMFICNHCPFVIHVQDQLAALGRDYAGRVSIFAINANNPDTHPDDAPDRMTETARAAGYTFPYLFDATQTVAHAFHAACTPDFFLFDADHTLAYRGQLDQSRPGNDAPVTGEDLRAAIDAVLRGEKPSPDQTPSMGCSIKWRPGMEPK